MVDRCETPEKKCEFVEMGGVRPEEKYVIRPNPNMGRFDP